MQTWNCSKLQNKNIFTLANLTKCINLHCSELEILKKILICLPSFSCKVYSLPEIVMGSVKEFFFMYIKRKVRGKILWKHMTVQGVNYLLRVVRWWPDWHFWSTWLILLPPPSCHYQCCVKWNDLDLSRNFYNKNKVWEIKTFLSYFWISA